MATGDDQAAGARPTRRLLSSIRDVLFDNTPDTPNRVSTNVTSNSPSTSSIGNPPSASSEVEAARTVLRAALEAQLGPGIREFSLQNQALSEVLPNVTVRRQTALRVLALKGTSRENLCAELEQVLGTLAAQGESFARKLQDRRDVLAASRQTAVQHCVDQTLTAEQTIATLQAELDAQRAQIAEEQTRRDQQLADADTAIAELGSRERAFQCAYQEIQSEYLALKTQLSQEFT